MADEVTTRILYPPNSTGFVDPIGYLKRGWRHVIFQITSLSDGTGEVGVRKMARGDLYGPSGLPCKRICIEEIFYHTHGMGVRLYFDMTPEETICLIPHDGSGCIKGPFLPSIAKYEDYEPGETGDIMLSTIATQVGANDTYDITIKMRIKEL